MLRKGERSSCRRQSFCFKLHHTTLYKSKPKEAWNQQARRLGTSRRTAPWSQRMVVLYLADVAQHTHSVVESDEDKTLVCPFVSLAHKR